MRNVQEVGTRKLLRVVGLKRRAAEGHLDYLRWAQRVGRLDPLAESVVGLEVETEREVAVLRDWTARLETEGSRNGGEDGESRG